MFSFENKGCEIHNARFLVILYLIIDKVVTFSFSRMPYSMQVSSEDFCKSSIIIAHNLLNRKGSKNPEFHRPDLFTLSPIYNLVALK